MRLYAIILHGKRRGALLKKTTTLHLEYGINLHADHIYKSYRPPKVTNTYPDPKATLLRKGLATYTGTSPEMIICGNGSDELLDIFVRMKTLASKKQTLAISQPTFFEYPKYASRIGARLVELSSDRSLITPEALRQRDASPEYTIVLIDIPSNPAGDIVTREQVVSLLDAGYTVIADEAYYEFYGKTVLDLIPKYPKQLAVARTFSKFCAMAGSRLGYMIADPAIIEKMNDLKPLFNVQSDAQARALFALDHIAEFQEAIEDIKKSHHSTRAAIEAIGTYQLFASLELFVIFKHISIPSAELQKRLSEEFAIETHHFADFKGDSVVRAVSGKMADMQRLTAALTTLA